MSFMLVEKFQADAWEELTDGIISYTQQNNISSSVILPTVSSSGKVGFTSDTLFSFTLDHDLVLNETVSIPLSSSATLKLSFYDASTIASLYPELNASPSYTGGGRVYELELNNGLKYVTVTHSSSDTRSFSAASFRSWRFSDYRIYLDYFYLYIEPGIHLFRKADLSYGTRYAFYYNGAPYTYKTVNNKYGLFNIYTDQPFDNKLFNTAAELVAWLCQEANFAFEGDSVSTKDDVDDYTAPVTSPITGDATDAHTKATQLANDAANTADGTVDVNIPTTEDVLEVAAENPAVVIDPVAAAELDIPVKPPDLPEIDKGSVRLWTTKFPFCLPFDVARIIGGFSATPQIPKLSFIFLPANSFGMNNQEIRIEIDFEPYDKFVQIFRFFLSAGFVFFLIKITRKLIS